MKTLRLNDEFILNFILLLLCLAPVAVSLLLFTNGKTTTFRFPSSVYTFGLPCAFKTATGYNCPVCGMTRCFTYMSGLNLKAAWEMSKAGVFLYLFCVFQVPYRFLLIIRRKLPFHKYLMVFEAASLIFIGLIAFEQFFAQFVNWL